MISPLAWRSSMTLSIISVEAFASSMHTSRIASRTVASRTSSSTPTFNGPIYKATVSNLLKLHRTERFLTMIKRDEARSGSVKKSSSASGASTEESALPAVVILEAGVKGGVI